MPYFDVAVDLHAAGVKTSYALFHLFAKVLLPATRTECVAADQGELGIFRQDLIVNLAVRLIVLHQATVHLRVSEGQGIIEDDTKFVL